MDEHPAFANSGKQSGGTVFHGCVYCSEAYASKEELLSHEKMMHPGSTFASAPVPMPERDLSERLRQAPGAAISKGMPFSEVARHCTPDSCWVAINGSVYDLTEFMDRHPGGPTTILSHAGTDCSKLFNEIHKGIKIENYVRPESYMGSLGVDTNLMSESFWHTLKQARIDEIKDELRRVMGNGSLPVKRQSVALALQDKSLGSELRTKLQTLETQKRVALDAEDFPKALAIHRVVQDMLGNEEQEELAAGIPLSRVARHNKPHDCWVALNDSVYDLTDFLHHHPDQRKHILAWAGRDATPMWNKIPGRFPSTTWMEFFMHPDFKIGNVVPEKPHDSKDEQIKLLQEELHRLEGPSDEDINAAKAAKALPAGAPSAKLSEQARFPRLQEVKADADLPFFTRAEVAKHNAAPGGPPGTEPYMIIHNKVYDLRPLLGNHPGGDELLLTRAGTDATDDFELFDHSEKARVRRDQEMLVGQLVPAECKDWTADAMAGVAEGGGDKATSEITRYLRYKALDALAALVGLYVYYTIKKRKPLPRLTYSRGLRHLHLIMAVGIFGSLFSAKAAGRSNGMTKKVFLSIHKQTGIAMLAALFVRILLRLRSGIPPRFPGNRLVQFVETQSLRAFYIFLFVLPVSGLANEYFLKWAPGSQDTGRKEHDEHNDMRAKQAMSIHTRVGNVFQLAWLPFHLGYTTAYHWSRGRGVVRKVSPFI
eukprot:TRINITY_DN1379_c0_g1_i5.p1 TRINITY_DN1379_c0_g1~~TRINITY_DN1379_c0_g1_i5.p1  ORF type:complete len:710 (+),score=135.25 TRINITY_DN1379_c0_g1_i5:63-2192(+)